MKVIDLLNKIANGEEVPKKVKYKTHYWEYKEEVKDYKDDEDDYVFSCSNYDITAMLDNEVEIIEEDKKIKRIQSCGDNLYSEYIGQWLANKENYTEYDELLMNKINEIIDYINKGDKE